MYALITGASSGIGRKFARVMAEKGYSLILVARREERLKEVGDELKKRFNTKTIIICEDLGKEDSVRDLIEKCRDLDIEVFFNNAGFGDCGKFEETDIEKEVRMIDLNVRSLHMLTKYFYKRFKKEDRGYILNTGSSAGLMPAGPYMATYYASKAYVVSLTQALARELKEAGSKTYIGVLCPGPVNTEFNRNANVTFSLPGIEAGDCAEYAARMMFRRKVIIVPTVTMKAAVFFGHFLPRSLMTYLAGNQQKKKIYSERSRK